MKYLYIIQIICIALTSCAQDRSDSLTVDEIWENHFKTLGGKEKLESVKTSSYSMVATSKNGTETRNLKIQYPDKIYFEIITPQNDTTIQILNGVRGITKHKGTTTELTGWDSLRLTQMAITNTELHFKENGYEMTRQMDTLINDIFYYNVLVNSPHKNMRYLFYKDSFRIFKLITDDLSIEFLNYTTINGILMPKKSKIIVGSNTLLVENKNQQLNITFDKTVFSLE